MNLSQELADKLAVEVKKVFPEGWVVSKAKTILMPVIHVHLGLIGDRNLLTGKILENDPVHHSFLVTEEGGKLMMERSQGRIYVKPEEGSYLAMQSVKTNFRKISVVSEDKLVASFAKWLNKLKALVDEHEANIYSREKYPNKYFN